MSKTQKELDVIVKNTIDTLGYFKDVERVQNATNVPDQLIYFGVKYVHGMRYFLVNDIDKFDDSVLAEFELLKKANPGYEDHDYLRATAIEIVLSELFRTKMSPFDVTEKST